MRQGIGTLLALLLCGVGLLPVAAQDATPEGESLLAGLGYPELVVTADGTDFTVPAEVEAGRYRLVLQNDSALSTELNLAQVPEGMTSGDVEAAFREAAEAEIPPLIYELVINGGPRPSPASPATSSSTWLPATGSSTSSASARKRKRTRELTSTRPSPSPANHRRSPIPRLRSRSA